LAAYQKVTRKPTHAAAEADAWSPRRFPDRPDRMPRNAPTAGGPKTSTATTTSPHHLMSSSPRTKKPIQMASAQKAGDESVMTHAQRDDFGGTGGAEVGFWSVTDMRITSSRRLHCPPRALLPQESKVRGRSATARSRVPAV
jgi:hypothetical protein